MKKIAFAGTDGRTLLWAHVVSTAKSEMSNDDYDGLVVRGTPAMPAFSALMKWPVEFVPTKSNSMADYAEAIIDALQQGQIDAVVPMPEGLLFDGLVDRVEAAGWGDRIIGLNQAGAFIEGDKIKCKELCRSAGIAVADQWAAVDARNYEEVLRTSLAYIDRYGGAVLKYPYSAGGKGARIILNTWQIKEVYDTLIADYKVNYKSAFGKKGPWPLLVESLMSGVEISFTILVDRAGQFQILPTAMDYPERYEGPASKDNPVTGGMGAISPHPIETAALMEMAGETIATPLVQQLKDSGLLRPCILYPGCFVSLTSEMQPSKIRVSEINIRPGEPEAQPVARRLRNLGALIKATLEGGLNTVAPEVRADQLSMCVALVTGPGGPDGQKGYPWSCTRLEPIEINYKALRSKGIQVIPSAMTCADQTPTFKSDGTRVAYLNVNATIKDGEPNGLAAERMGNKLLNAFNGGRIRVIPREDPEGNRLDLRRDIGRHFGAAEKTFL